MAILFALAPLKMVRGTYWFHDTTIVDAVSGLPVDLSGIAGMLLRVREDATSPVLLELSLANTTLIIVNALNGIVGIRASSALTNTLPTNDHQLAAYSYDAVIERTPNEYEAALSGILLAHPQISRPLDDPP